MNLINEIYSLNTADLIAACKFSNPMMNSFQRLAKKSPAAVYNHLTQFKLNHTKHDHYTTLVLFDWLIYLQLFWDLLIKDLTGSRKEKHRALTVIEYCLGLSISRDYIPFYGQLDPAFEQRVTDHVLNIINNDGILDGNMQHTKITLMSLNIASFIVRKNGATERMVALLTALEPYAVNNYSLIFINGAKDLTFDEQVLDIICQSFSKKLSITEFINELIEINDFYHVFKMCALIANSNMEEIDFSLAIQGITMIVFSLRILDKLEDHAQIYIVSHLIVFIVKKRKVLEEWIVDMMLQSMNSGIALMWLAVDYPIIFQKIKRLNESRIVEWVVKEVVKESSPTLVHKLAFDLMLYCDRVDLLPVFQLAKPEILDLLLNADSPHIDSIVVRLLNDKDCLLYMFEILNSLSSQHQSFDESFDEMQNADCKELNLMANFAKQNSKRLSLEIIFEILDYSYRNAESLLVLKGLCSILSFLTWNQWKFILPVVQESLQSQERISPGIDIKRLLFKKLHYLFVLQIMPFDNYEMAVQEHLIDNIADLLYQRISDPGEFVQVINECFNVIARLPLDYLCAIIDKELVEPETLILQVIANRPQFLQSVDIKKILGIIKNEYNDKCVSILTAWLIHHIRNPEIFVLLDEGLQCKNIIYRLSIIACINRLCQNGFQSTLEQKLKNYHIYKDN